MTTQPTDPISSAAMIAERSEPQYDPASARMCRACAHAASHNNFVHQWGARIHCAPVAECSEAGRHGCACTESDRLIADLRHALEQERAQEREGATCELCVIQSENGPCRIHKPEAAHWFAIAFRGCDHRWIPVAERLPEEGQDVTFGLSASGGQYWLALPPLPKEGGE